VRITSFTKPILIRFVLCFRRIRGIEPTHYGYTTASTSADKEQDRTITKVVEYQVQLLPIPKMPNTQHGLQDRDALPTDWQSIGPYGVLTCCESKAHRKPSKAINYKPKKQRLEVE
jgi:hypothetical protein